MNKLGPWPRAADRGEPGEDPGILDRDKNKLGTSFGALSHRLAGTTIIHATPSMCQSGLLSTDLLRKTALPAASPLYCPGSPFRSSRTKHLAPSLLTDPAVHAKASGNIRCVVQHGSGMSSQPLISVLITYREHPYARGCRRRRQRPRWRQGRRRCQAWWWRRGRRR